MITTFNEKINFVITKPGQGTVTTVAKEFGQKFGDDSIINDIRVLQIYPSELPSIIENMVESANENPKTNYLMLFNEVYDLTMITVIHNTIKSFSTPTNLYCCIVAFEDNKEW